MRETIIQLNTIKPVGEGETFDQRSTNFDDKEVSTLKTVISNLNEHGFMTVYELVEHKEMFVDPKYYPNAVKKIFHNRNPNMKVTKEQFPQWIRTYYKIFVEYFIDHIWNWEFKGEETWKQEDFVDCMIDSLDENFFNVVYVETVVNYLGIYLNKEDAEGQLRAYDGYFTEKMEIKERKIYGSEVKSLYKLLSLLSL